jgi:hypothetical protein
MRLSDAEDAEQAIGAGLPVDKRVDKFVRVR